MATKSTQSVTAESSNSPAAIANASTSTTINANSAAPVRLIPKQKLTSIARFKSFGRSKKEKKPALVFPPPSWSLDETKDNGADASALDNKILLNDIVDNAVDEIEEPPEPKSFARKIRELIDSLPIPGSGPVPQPASQSVPNSTVTTNESKPITTPVLDPRGPPVASVVDSRLMKLLSSESVMNGSVSRGRQSVWEVLDHLRHGKQRVGGEKGEAEETRDQEQREEGVMMYAPIEPSPDSEVEIADSEIVLEYADADGHWHSEKNGKGREGKDGEDSQDTGKNEGKEKRRWPFIGAKGKGKAKEKEKEKKKEKEKEEKEKEEKEKKEKAGDGEKDNQYQGQNSKGQDVQETGESKEAKEDKETDKKNVTEHRVWVPSETKMSLQAMWWGYRLYLPPPVLAILDNTHIVAAKRAALITTALKWLLDHVPTLMVPPQLRPGLMLLKRLSPLLGYIGVFIAWSWGAIKEKDKGQLRSLVVWMVLNTIDD